MNDRVQSALRSLGIEGTPVAALERGDAFFALLNDLLVYQDEQGTRRVTLRDLTRIHSDQGGLLRVETPAGTALTASLLGFDPARVQPFFAQVRDATARAKNLPAAPLPTPGGLKTFGSALKTSAPQGNAGASAAPLEPAGKPAVKAEQPEVKVEQAEPEKPAPTVWAGMPPARPAAQPEPRSEARVVAVTASPAPVAQPEPQKLPVKPTPVAPKPDAEQKAPARPLDLLPALAERANAVHGLVSRLRLLAGVLGLAAVGLAAVQYLEGAPLQGLWTLIAGGVGAVALFIFADVTRLIVALARAVAEGRGTGAGAAIPARND
jgi:hypothetical protein